MRRSCLSLPVLSLLLSGALLLGFSGHLTAQPFGDHRGDGPGGDFFPDLTDEQRQVVHELMNQMRVEGAGPEEIHTAISELFAEWGLELPEHPGRDGGQEGLDERLSQEQRAALHSTRLQMWQGGATREEIHKAVVEMIKGWGIEPADGKRDDGSGRFSRRQGAFRRRLTDEQHQAIRGTIEQLRDQGATREQIHDAIASLFEEWGIELPERQEGRHHFGADGPLFYGPMAQLNQEQREQMRQLVHELRQQGASHDEIRAAAEERLAEWGIAWPVPPPELTLEQRKTLRAVFFELWKGGSTGEEIRSAAAQQLGEYGIELPEQGPGLPGHGPRPGWHGRGPLPDAQSCLRPSLTKEQRETLHETIRGLRQQGASAEQIHQAVRSLMDDFGVEVPDLDSQLTSEQRSTLRTSTLDLWLAGASREDICEEVTELLDNLGIELPEESGELAPDETSDTAPIRAQNYPNPANPETQIQYTLSLSGKVQILIYNISGQLVRAFDMGYLQSGSYSVIWDGRRHDGQPVASGVYFYRIQAGQHAVTNRMVLLK